MKILVCIKQVPDTEAKISILPDRSGIDCTNIKWIMNPYDEYALEEALRTKEKMSDTLVTAISIGPKQRVVDCLRTALAIGADDAIVVDAPADLDSFQIAETLSKVVEKEGGYDLIFTGKIAIDDSAACVSQSLAGFLNIPHASVVSKFTHEQNSVVVERDVEGGTKEIVEMQKPALIAANKGLNMPRYASLPGIMKAKKKPLKEFSLDLFSLTPDSQKIIYSDYQPPQENPPIKMLQGTPAEQSSLLVKLLREEVKVI